MKDGVDLGDAIGLGHPAVDEVHEPLVEVEHAIGAELPRPFADEGLGIGDLSLAGLAFEVDALDDLKANRRDPDLDELGHPLLPLGVEAGELLALGVENTLL